MSTKDTAMTASDHKSIEVGSVEHTTLLGANAAAGDDIELSAEKMPTDIYPSMRVWFFANTVGLAGGQTLTLKLFSWIRGHSRRRRAYQVC